jgi:phosphoribosylglycinamide formyltransferase-1
MANPTPSKLGVFLSGTGRSLENLCKCIEHGSLNASISVVVGSRQCPAIDKAKARSIPTHIHTGVITPADLDALVTDHQLDLIILAGYLKRIPITDRTRGKIINIHPALLPNFGGPGMHGMHVHRAVINAYQNNEVTHSGCTVHFCDETYDTGSTILQHTCQIEPNDTPDSLAAKVFALECKALPEAISIVCQGL